MSTKKIEGFLKNIRSSLGLELKIRKYPYGEKKRRIDLINHFSINKILDIGANQGQYGKQMRQLGYKGIIVSYEPMTLAFNLLKQASKMDQHWHAYQLGLGDLDKNLKINISQNSFSSSILDVMESHTDPFPDSSVVDHEEITVKKLDSIFSTIYKERDKIFMKIDTQGYEMLVLKGAKNSLSKISGVQLEMALTPLYQGEKTYKEIIEFMEDKGFHLYSVEPGLTHPQSGKLLQMDGIFFKD